MLQPEQLKAAAEWYGKKLAQLNPALHPGQMALFKHALCTEIRQAAEIDPLLMRIGYHPKLPVSNALCAADIKKSDVQLPKDVEMLFRKDGSLAVKSGARAKYEEIYTPLQVKHQPAMPKGLAA